MKSNSLTLNQRSYRNLALAIYITGITVFMTVYTALLLTQ